MKIVESENDPSVASGHSITVSADFPTGFEAGLGYTNPSYVFDAADDRGRIDYRDSNGTLVTRLGIGLAERNILVPGAADLTPLDVPLKQTDGVHYFAEVIRTRDASIGSDDQISTGLSNDQVFGGLGGDTINTGLSRDIVIADHGILDFATDNIDPANLDRITSTDTAFDGNDIVTTGNGTDIVLAGPANDLIIAGGNDSATDFVIGDNGEVVLASPSDPSHQ